MALDFNPLQFFKDEINNDSAAVKIGAVNKLDLIAHAMGPQKTLNELIPYVIQVIYEEPFCNDEEFLFSIAKQCAMLAQFTGGQDEILMPPLEHLAAQEETVIRDQAVESLCTIVEKRPALAPEYLVPLLHRLSNKTDFFTARVSACSLFPTAYRFATNDQKDKIRKAFVTICSDDTPMVRRAAAYKLKDLIAVCDKQDVLVDLIAIYRNLSQEDTQDTIRVACVNTTLVLAKMLSADENRQHTLAVIKEAGEDRSWRVRLTVAKTFDQLCVACGPELTASDLLPQWSTFMKDHEQEVRKEALLVLEPCLRQCLNSERLQQHIMPAFSAIAIDTAQPVRAAFAKVLGPVAKQLGRDLTQRHLLSIISDLLKDEFHEVRLNMVSHSGLICEVLSVEHLVHSLLHTIQSLIMDNHWRIRQSVVEQIPKLAKLFGVEMFQTKLESLFLPSLNDSVHSVRKAAINNIKEITVTFGTQWTVEHLTPKIMEMYQTGSAGYANRVTTLQVLPEITHVMTAEQIVQLIVPLLAKATKDSVPNVRFCSCKIIIWMLQNHVLGGAQIDAKIKPSLRELQQDSDVDVQYYAQRALALC